LRAALVAGAVLAAIALIALGCGFHVPIPTLTVVPLPY
jgi:hypothetical protein